VLLPLLLLGATTGAVDVKSAAAAGVAAVVAFAVVVLRALTGLRAAADAPAGAQVVDRVVSAAAAAVLAFVTADGFDLLTADGGAIGTAAGLSAVTAVAQWFLQRPAAVVPGEVVAVDGRAV